MFWRRIHCAVNVPRELENLTVRPRETGLREYVGDAARCAVLGTFIREISILLSIEGRAM